MYEFRPMPLNMAWGACLMQEGRPVAYASRAMTTTERKYAQIEKELLAICYAFVKFRQSILGKQITIESDHKPLEMITKKELHLTPLRLERMLLRLQPYDLMVTYTKGADMHIADALSRATTDPPEDYLDEGWMIYDIQTVTHTRSDTRLEEFHRNTANDPELQALTAVIIGGWPTSSKSVEAQLRPYWSVRDRLSVLDGLVFMGERLVVPQTMREYVLDIIHGSHFGIEKSKLRALQSVYWPSILKAIENKVMCCQLCQRHQKANVKEPMILP